MRGGKPRLATGDAYKHRKPRETGWGWTDGGDGPVGEVGWTDVGGGLMVVDGCVADWWW